MAMNRTGIPTLMGFQEGGDVDTDQNITDTSGIRSAMLDPQDVTQNFALYSGLLNQLAPEPRRLTGYDLASELGRGLLAQQGEKLPSLGRGIGLGFQSFKELSDDIEEKRRKAKADRDAMAFGLATKSKSAGSVKRGDNWMATTPEGQSFFREVLVDGDVYYKGEGQVLNIQEFDAKYPNARPYASGEAGKYQMGLSDFTKAVKTVRENEQSLDALQDYIATFDDANVGFSRIGTDIENFFNTIFATGEITSAELAQGMSEAKFQALIGRFREEVVGPGVMTEFDAERIIAALGAEPGALQNPFRMKAILKDVFGDKVDIYNDALLIYNLGAGSGQFKGFEEKTAKKWDMSMFDSPLTVPEGATFIEEVKNAKDKSVAVIYTNNGKTYRRNLNGTIEEIKNKDTSGMPSTIPLPD